MNDPLSVQEIRAAVSRIAEMGDAEAQHGLRDDLLVKVLVSIAEGAANPEEMAREALTVEELDFGKWFA